ncbi:MAG: single-stranded DNA-binding protein [Bacteroidia bacterium]|nr:single-stranded DNA-binding protein [Bacteroidia bacterium]
MNSLKNKVQLIGNLGMNPEVKEFGNGKVMARFSLATSENYKNDDGRKVENTQWHNVVAWGKTAIIAKNYLAKGRPVAIEGRLVHRAYQDKDGNTKYISEIVINDMLLLRSGNKNAA